MTTIFDSKRTLFASVFAASLFLAGCGALTAPIVQQEAPTPAPVEETVSHAQNAPHNLPNADEDNTEGDTQSAPVTHNRFPGE